MKVDEFDYPLPRELIAQKPCPERDKCRLLVLSKEKGNIEHRIFREIIQFLNPGDVLVINTTKVIPARLKGHKERTGGKAEIFLLERMNNKKWKCLLRPYRRIKKGSIIVFPGTELKARLIQRTEKNTGIVEFTGSSSPEKTLFEIGEVPLPPYIKREKGPSFRDRRGYQTVYAENPGAVAAPTAGLHFTPSLLKTIQEKGVGVAKIILHTGWASFFSLDKPRVEENALPPERFRIPPSAAEKVNRCKINGGRVIAVGTTVVRALESNCQKGELKSGAGLTDLFIYPGYRFKCIHALLTNFHFPRSSLLLLVAAFVGKEKLMEVYKEAIDEGYRFLSYGDAMLII